MPRRSAAKKKPESVPSAAHLRGDRLRQLREAKGWHQKDVAGRTSLHVSRVSELESGKIVDLRVSTLVELCTLFGASADFLLGLSNDSRPRA